VIGDWLKSKDEWPAGSFRLLVFLGVSTNHESPITNHFKVQSSLTGSNQALNMAAVFVPPENENRIA
jgi:hypothetical protein